MNESQTTDQIFISKLTEIILVNLADQSFGVHELARESGLSLYRLNRKLNSILRITTNQFIREVRLRKAKELLQNEPYTAAEVAYRVGFGSPAYFTKKFHEFYGYPPGKIQRRDPNIPEPDVLAQVLADYKTVKSAGRSYAQFLAVLFLLVLAAGLTGYLIYRKINKTEWTERLMPSDDKISFAVIPFQNLANDTTLNNWQYWIQWSLISALANTGDFEVRQIESVRTLLRTNGITEYASIPPGTAGSVSKTLKTDMFIYGNLQHAGTRVRIDAQLIETKTNDVIRSFEINGLYGEEMIFDLTDTLKKKITDFLIVSKLTKENPRTQHLYTQTRSADALRNFIQGDRAYFNKDYSTARKYFLNALAADSNYNLAALMLEKTYAKANIQDEKFRWLVRNYEKRYQMPYAEQLYASWAYAFSFEPPDVRIRYLKLLQGIDALEPGIPYLLGYTYNRIDQFEKAIPELERSLEISRKWGREYLKDVAIYLELGDAYHKTGRYRKERKLYRMAEKYIPEEPWIIRFQARLALSQKDSKKVDRYLTKYISVLKGNSSSEGTIAAGLAWIYSMSGIPDKAEENYRRSVMLEPDNTSGLHNFATFLINKNRHLDEVSGLMDRAMELAPDRYSYYNYSDTKGWGVYKQGKHKEALEILEKTWNDAPYKLYSIKSHLEEVRKAVAGQ